MPHRTSHDELTMLIEQHRGQLHAFCARFQDDPHDRDELAQLVLIRIWHGFAGFDHRCTFSTWLYRIVRNTAISEYERRRRRPVPIDATGDDARPLWHAAPVPVEDALLAREMLARALAEVDEPFRRVVELVDLWGCPHAEVAELTGIAEATVRTRLFRGRRTLRAAVGPTAA